MNACILLVLCLKGCLNYRFLLGPNLFVKKGKKKIENTTGCWWHNCKAPIIRLMMLVRGIGGSCLFPSPNFIFVQAVCYRYITGKWELNPHFHLLIN